MKSVIFRFIVILASSLLINRIEAAGIKIKQTNKTGNNSVIIGGRKNAFSKSADHIIGSGKVIQEKHDLGEQSIKIFDAQACSELVVQESTKNYLILKGDDNIISRVKVTLSSGELIIEEPENFSTNHAMECALMIKRAKELVIIGIKNSQILRK